MSLSLDEFIAKGPDILQQTQAIARCSLKELKDIVDDPNLSARFKIIYRLEYNYRLNGGMRPIETILDKAGQDYKREMFLREEVYISQQS